MGWRAFASTVRAAAAQALTLLTRHLPAATADAQDVAARGRCQIAAWLSLYSLSNVMVGLSHAIGHQLGGRCHVPHGVTSRLTLAAVMDFNRPASASRQAIAARAMDIDTRDLSDEAAAAVRALVRTIGIKDRLRDWNVTQVDLEPIAEGTMTEFLLATNPRRVESARQVHDTLCAIL